MNQLPEELEGLNLMEDSDSSSSTSSQSSNEQRVLRKRSVDSPLPPPTQYKQKRRCLQIPKKKETLAQIKKIYLNLNFKEPCQNNLETIFEESDDKTEEDLNHFGKQKIRRSIIFRDGIVNKLKAKHRKRMVKRLDSVHGHGPRPRKKIRLSLDAVLERIAEDLDSADIGETVTGPLKDMQTGD